MSSDEYHEIMQILNLRQYELCVHVMHQLENNRTNVLVH